MNRQDIRRHFDMGQSKSDKTERGNESSFKFKVMLFQT